MTRRATLTALALAVPVAAGIGLAATDTTAPGTAQVTASDVSSAEPATPDVPTGPAAAAVARLTVKGRGPGTGYTRGQFMPRGWTDPDRNGCDTRNDILRRDLTHLTTRGRTGCVAVSGILRDPYTGRTITWQRGPGSDRVQVDHVVPLKDAWVKGAAAWPAARRERFAQDPLNLLATAAAVNASKGDSDAATWLPPNRAARCAYVARQAAVKTRYRLTITQAERTAMLRVLAACPGQRLPAGGRPPKPIRAKPAQAPSTTSQEPGGGAVYYRSCAAARAAGAAPIRRGEPGYRAGLDRDGDGTACDT